MNLLSARGIEVAFGDRAVLRGADLAVGRGDRVGLVGANGSGKSTLLRVLGGRITPDHGRLEHAARVATLDQDPDLPGETVAACAEAAIAWHRALLAEYQRRAGTDEGAALHDRLDLVGWEVEHRVDAMLERLGAPPRTARVADLSGGERRRVALALTLLGSPEVLLLDEPTNHLDADAVEWLQAWLLGFRGALVLVTHDRYLLEAVADRIVEIEAGQCVAYEGSYGDFLVARAERQAMLQKAEDKRLDLIAREAAWAARSPAARSTKQKARLQRLEDLQSQGRIHLEQAFELDLRTGHKAGGVVLEVHGLRKAYDRRELFGGLDLALSGGERIGVLGPNGCGKSTLLRILAGTEVPDSGEVVRGARVNVAVMDQARSGLDDEVSVAEAAGGGSSHVFVGEAGPARWQTDSKRGGTRAVHVASYLERFLFPREMHDQPVSTLSGGERARLLLARLLLAGANVLLLDEPTNDLDLSTLRVLEEALLSYDGAVVVVTHDRAFLDRVCTAVLAFEGDKVVRYASRMQHLRAVRERERATESAAEPPKAAEAPRPRATPGKLSWREQRELEALPGQIEALETEQAALSETLADPETYRSRSAEVAALQARSAAIEAEIEALFGRWAELEGRG